MKVKLPYCNYTRNLEDNNEVQSGRLWFVNACVVIFDIGCFCREDLGLMSLLVISRQYIFYPSPFESIHMNEISANTGRTTT